MNDIPLFVPSYHRPHSLKTVKYFKKMGYDTKRIWVFIDSEADDKVEYEESCHEFGCNLVVFDMNEARERYDYVHRPSVSRRSAGQARNMFQDFAKNNGIDFYVVQDDDTSAMGRRKMSKGQGRASIEHIRNTFWGVEAMMRKWHIGVWGLSQGGDYYGTVETNPYRHKVMNTTFYLLPYIYRGERGVQDDDTSLFCGIMNEGLFTGSLRDGVMLYQTPSATQGGG